MSLNEADTRAKLIDPAIHVKGWSEDLIKREETAGAVEIINGQPRRGKRGKTDYTLRLLINPGTQPVAVALIEAKPESKPANFGLEQAKQYARCKLLNVHFAFSSNGHQFVLYDCQSGLTSLPKPIIEFPTPVELRARYEDIVGFSLSDPLASPLLARYPGGEATRRYYQDAAIRAVLEKIIFCRKQNKPQRALLALATGAGKTFIAVHLLKKLAEAGQLKRALFVCDRDELRNQGLGVMQNIFGADTAEVFRKPDGENNAKNARIHVATYQTLNVDTPEGDANFLQIFYPPNYFSHIIIDECHRSAWGKWSEILKRNPDAVQVGLTATPRQLEISENTSDAEDDRKVTADNLAYFGEPVYEYDMSQGIEDGYLAACEIQRGRINLDDTGITLDEIIARNPINAVTGLPMSANEIREFYEKTEYEDQIFLPDRVLAMSRDLFKYLVETGGPEQKTIVFCVRDFHADAVAIALNNLYAEWCRENQRQRLEPYAFKCTASVGGSQFLADLRGAPRSHFIATTVDLLSTGVDVPCVRNIVFFKYVKSPISFYQMVGRGTRLDPASNKLMFRIYDYTNATRLFGKDFFTKEIVTREYVPRTSPEPQTIIQVEGFEVRISDAGRLILTNIGGKAMPVTVEEYKEKLAERLVAEAPTLEFFRERWVNPLQRLELMAQLPDAGLAPALVRQLEEMGDYDLYDVLAELGYGLAPRTRKERAAAFSYKHQTWLESLPEKAAGTLRALCKQFVRSGTEGLENPKVFQTPEVVKAGGLAALKAFGKAADILHETKWRIFAV